MSHQWPSKAHLQQGDVAFCNVNILIIITRTGGKNHLYPPLFLIKIMSTSLIKQHCLDMQICSVTHRSHDSLTGFLSCHKISSKKLLITMGSQWTWSNIASGSGQHRPCTCQLEQLQSGRVQLRAQSSLECRRVNISVLRAQASHNTHP